MTAAARAAACILFSCAAAHASPPEALGRLFYSPEERARLDQLRQAGSGGPAVVNGRVMRSRGGNTVWVNGTAMDESQAPAEAGWRLLAGGPARPAAGRSGALVIHPASPPGAAR